MWEEINKTKSHSWIIWREVSGVHNESEAPRFDNRHRLPREDNRGPLQLLENLLPGPITGIQNYAFCQKTKIQSEATNKKKLFCTLGLTSLAGPAGSLVAPRGHIRARLCLISFSSEYFLSASYVKTWKLQYMLCECVCVCVCVCVSVCVCVCVCSTFRFVWLWDGLLKDSMEHGKEK
jgi:hypothetical protein